MNFVKKFALIIRKAQFEPGWIGVFVNPVYIMRSELHKCIKVLGLRIHGSVLDFGCGSKPYEKIFHNVTNYIGCDTHNSGHNHTNSKADCYYNGKSLPFADKTFDSVVSFEVFEHVFDLPASLKEINRVTKEDGLLLISIPFAWAEHEIPFDYARYSSYGITHLLREHGFHVLEMKKTGPSILAVFQLLIAYLTQIAPKNKFYYIFQVFLFFPLTLFAYLFSALLPRKNELYLGNVICAQKVTEV